MKFGDRLLRKRAKDSWGDNAYVFWIADCFDPVMVLVRGESFEDAYEWFLCDPWVEPQLRIDDYFEDYIEGWDRKWVYGVGNTNKATFEDLNKAYSDGKTSGAVSVNDNGVFQDTEAVQGVEFDAWRKQGR